MKVNTWVYKHNEDYALKLLARRGAWGKFVNAKLAEESQKPVKTPLKSLKKESKSKWLSEKS